MFYWKEALGGLDSRGPQQEDSENTWRYVIFGSDKCGRRMDASDSPSSQTRWMWWCPHSLSIEDKMNSPDCGLAGGGGWTSVLTPPLPPPFSVLIIRVLDLGLPQQPALFPLLLLPFWDLLSTTVLTVMLIALYSSACSVPVLMKQRTSPLTAVIRYRGLCLSPLSPASLYSTLSFLILHPYWPLFVPWTWWGQLTLGHLQLPRKSFLQSLVKWPTCHCSCHHSNI